MEVTDNVKLLSPLQNRFTIKNVNNIQQIIYSGQLNQAWPRRANSYLVLIKFTKMFFKFISFLIISITEKYNFYALSGAHPWVLGRLLALPLTLDQTGEACQEQTLQLIWSTNKLQKCFITQTTYVKVIKPFYLLQKQKIK